MDGYLDGHGARAHAVIAGGGIAGIETALALRALVGDDLHITLAEPSGRFRMAATATGRAFGVGTTIEFPMAELAGRLGADHRVGRLVAVDPERRIAMLAGGELLHYDMLVVAVGARPEPFLPEALTFTGHADAPALRMLVEGIATGQERGSPRDLAVVVPPDCGWPIAAYELALMTRRVLAEREGTPGRVMVVTAEERPLALFGTQATDAVSAELERAGVELELGAVVRGWRWGRLELAGRSDLSLDRVVALPVLRGPWLEGLPRDDHGFVRTKPDGTIPGVDDVWVVGDAGSFPVKQGGVACQQADAAAAAIAARVGADVDDEDFAPVLRGWVWDGAEGRFIRADLGGGHSESPGVDGLEPLWWPVMKVAGRYLSPFLQGLPLNVRLTDVAPEDLRV